MHCGEKGLRCGADGFRDPRRKGVDRRRLLTAAVLHPQLSRFVILNENGRLQPAAPIINPPPTAGMKNTSSPEPAAQHPSRCHRIRELLCLRILVFSEGRADEFRIALVQGDDDEGGAGFLVILGILGCDAVDDGEGGEDISLQHAAPLDDVVLFVNEVPAPGFHGGRVKVAGLAVEAHVDPAAEVAAAVEEFVAAVAGAEVLEVVDLRFLLQRGIAEDGDYLALGGGVEGRDFSRKAVAGEEEGEEKGFHSRGGSRKRETEAS